MTNNMTRSEEQLEEIVGILLADIDYIDDQLINEITGLTPKDQHRLAYLILRGLLQKSKANKTKSAREAVVELIQN